MDAEMASWKSTGTYVDEVPPPGANIVNGMWIFRVKRPPGSPPAFKERYVARGFSQRQGVDYFQTFSPTPKMTTLWVLLHVAAQCDYELHSLDFSTAFLQGSLHEEIWLRRPPGFTGSFPAGTQWSLRRPVYGLRQAPREWHDTLRTTLAALGFAPSIADPSLFLRTDTSLPPFHVPVYIDDLVFATADTEPQPTPLSTSHSLSATPSDESVETLFHELVDVFLTGFPSVFKAAWVRFPTRDELPEMAREFAAIKGVPAVVGAVDGTHIHMKGMEGHRADVHDMRVFKESALLERLHNGDIAPYQIVGDAAYLLREYCLTPLHAPRGEDLMDDWAQCFNYYQSATRMAVERCIGAFKGRWRIFGGRNDCRLWRILAGAACCVILHNMCEEMAVPTSSPCCAASGGGADSPRGGGGLKSGGARCTSGGADSVMRSRASRMSCAIHSRTRLSMRVIASPRQSLMVAETSMAAYMVAVSCTRARLGVAVVGGGGAVIEEQGK
ncbi:unnamed protein product [Closterium sp. NIES-54]